MMKCITNSFMTKYIHKNNQWSTRTNARKAGAIDQEPLYIVTKAAITIAIVAEL